jgi:hypothetical protein
MNINFSHIAVVFDFIDVGFKTQQIYQHLLPSVIEKMKENKLTLPMDWSLIFQAAYANGKLPLVSKNKLGSYPSDKMKYITIVVPIPLETEISWGVKPEQHLYGKDHYDKLMRNFWKLDIDFKNYSNRTDYITACLKAGVKKSFEEGFTVGGAKVTHSPSYKSGW